MDYAVTFACLNQVDFTEKCVRSLLDSGVDRERIVAVDNASTDQTSSRLNAIGIRNIIRNSANFGCGVAWNQGVLALQAEWTVVMNNDILVCDGWLDGLLTAAKRFNVNIVCPAMIEGDLDYNFKDFARDASAEMEEVVRFNIPHAVCMAIHKSVWLNAGFFMPVPKLLGFEDTIFFNELNNLNISTVTTGASWIHHFGSITQKAMKLERGIPINQGLGTRSNKRLLNKNFYVRKIQKWQKQRSISRMSSEEFVRYRKTVHGLRKNGSFEWL